MPVEQLDVAVRGNAALAPLNLASPESVRVLVPVPLQSWDPRLLITETIDPEFQQTLDRFLLNRSRALGARQGLRVRAGVLERAITGQAPAVVAWNDDALALEPESLSPWGPPPSRWPPWRVARRRARALLRKRHRASPRDRAMPCSAGSTSIPTIRRAR